MEKIKPPIENFEWSKNISQLFGVNKKLYKKQFGLEGHNGIDIVVRGIKKGYGTPIKAAHAGVITKVVIETRWRTKGNGIYLQSLDRAIETVYWHLSEIQVAPGQKVKEGETIGLMGNTGWVRPVPAPQKPYAGTHLHFAVKTNGWTDYGGFVDPLPFLYGKGDKLPIYWARNLFWGSSGDDVSWLQSVLKLEGFAEDYEPIGFMGRKTIRDMRKYQKRYGIEPSYGFVGLKTRTFLMKQYSIYGI
jgi:hypothetical protein